jgi:hypothetical protein
MAHDGSMAALGTHVKPALSELQGAVEELQTAVRRMATCIRAADAPDLGEGLIQIREVGIDPLEAVFASGLRRFDQAGEYKADGALARRGLDARANDGRSLEGQTSSPTSACQRPIGLIRQYGFSRALIQERPQLGH